jgi:cytochrome o ubiquinol oxidase subunit 3
MSQTTTLGHGHDVHHDADHVPSQSVFGFWLYLMTDCIIFASLFAVFAVMSHQFAGGPTAKDLFEIPGVALETAALLLSSITYGFAMIGAHKGKKGMVLGWLAVTFLLGASFLVLEPDRRGRRSGPQRVLVVVLHAGRHARFARDVRPAVDDRAERAGDPQS